MAVESPQSPQRFRPSALRGLKDLLLSPLFLVITVFNVASGFLLFQRTGDLYIAIYAPLALEVLAVAVVWQYVMVAARTEGLRVELLHGQEVRLRSALERVGALDDRMVQLMGELSGDQSRVIEHLCANRSAVEALGKELDSRLGDQGRGLLEASKHFGRIEDGLRQAMENMAKASESQAEARQELSDRVETLREIFSAEHESMPDLMRGVSVSVQKFMDQVGRVIVQRLDELHDLVTDNKGAIPEGRMEQLRVEIEDELDRLIRRMSEQQEQLPGRIDALGDLVFRHHEEALAKRVEQLRGEIGEEIDRLSHQLAEQQEKLPARIQGILPDSAGRQEADENQALDVATALDRLNLEVRRQMTLLRNQIEQN